VSFLNCFSPRGSTGSGVSAGEITDVLVSHLHFDHVGGATRMVEGKVVSTFPKAKIWIQKEHLDHACCPTPKDRASFLREFIDPLKEWGQLQTFEGATEFLPGIDIELSHGHTKSQQIIKVRGDNKTVVFCADMIPTSTHLHLPYVMGFDLFPLTTMEEKKILLEQAAKDKWILVWEHDPYFPSGTVKLEKGKFVREDVVRLD